MKIKYNVADIKPEIIDLMKEYVSEEEQTEVVADLYWMLVFAHRSEKSLWPEKSPWASKSMIFRYKERNGSENSYYLSSVALWDKIYKKARKDYKHGKERW